MLHYYRNDRALNRSFIQTTGGALAVEIDDAGRYYTTRNLKSNQIVKYDDSVCVEVDALKEATKRGISYHRIHVPRRGHFYIPHEEFLKKAHRKPFAVPQLGLPIHEWCKGLQPPVPPPATDSSDASANDKEAGE